MGEEKIKVKKWIIVVSALILIAIIVTLIIVFLPKSTKQVAEIVNDHSQSMFLKNKDDDSNFKELQSKINANLGPAAIQETKNVYNLFGILTDVIEFYNQNIVFAEDNSNYQSNISAVIRNLDSANKAKEKLNSSIADAKRIGSEDNSFINGQWPKIRDIFLEYLSSYSNAIQALNKIYQGSMPKGIMVSEATCLVLDNIDNYLTSIKQNFVDTQAVANAKRIEFFKSFLSYIKTTKLEKYKFTPQLQSEMTIIKSFENVYETSFIDLIDSINATDFTFASIGSDQSGVLEKTENFLKGGLAV